jgi:aryl-alcohol dehydrogenase-like predicted oxidoreductase
MNRRQFLSTTVAGAAGALLAGSAGAAAASVNPFQLVPLGKSGLKVSLIGCGTGMSGGMRQSNQTRMGKEKFEALLNHAWDQGCRMFDCADLYGTNLFVGACFKNKPREQFVLCSKIWTRTGGIPEKERPDANIVVDRFRKELQTDYIDLVLIHCMDKANWTDQEKRQMDIMADLKAKGIIKAHGVSIHSLPALKLCAETPWVDSVHARINPFGLHMDGKVDEVVPVLKAIHDAGKGVVGMKIVGQGDFRNDPARKDESVKFVMGLGSVDMMIVGFEKPEEVDDFSSRVKKVLESRATV